MGIRLHWSGLELLISEKDWGHYEICLGCHSGWGMEGTVGSEEALVGRNQVTFCLWPVMSDKLI